jgi:hypothetical protein
VEGKSFFIDVIPVNSLIVLNQYYPISLENSSLI